MHAEQRRFLEERYDASAWHGRSPRRGRPLKGFTFEGVEIPGWALLRTQRDDREEPPAIRSIWSRGEDRLLAVDLFECASVKAAHDQLIEALGNFESDAIERQAEKGAPGDVAFALGDTMVLFARGNLVVLIRNAGRTAVSVRKVARELDGLLGERLESEGRR